MKKAFVLPTLILFCLNLNAQGLSNFFSQKKADIQYMLQQIAALQVYIGYAEKGYNIAQQGLTTIGEIKKGELDLHNAFFSSLKTINPAVSNYSRVADIISIQLAIVSDFKKALQRVRQSSNFSAAEITYLNTVYSNMSDECANSLTELIDIVTSGTLEMKDNERIGRIDTIYIAMREKYAFTQSFTNEAGLLGAQRQNETDEIELLKKLN